MLSRSALAVLRLGPCLRRSSHVLLLGRPSLLLLKLRSFLLSLLLSLLELRRLLLRSRLRLTPRRPLELRSAAVGLSLWTSLAALLRREGLRPLVVVVRRPARLVLPTLLRCKVRARRTRLSVASLHGSRGPALGFDTAIRKSRRSGLPTRALPLTATETIRRGRVGPGQCGGKAAVCGHRAREDGRLWPSVVLGEKLRPV